MDTALKFYLCAVSTWKHIKPIVSQSQVYAEIRDDAIIAFKGAPTSYTSHFIRCIFGEKQRTFSLGSNSTRRGTISLSARVSGTMGTPEIPPRGPNLGSGVSNSPLMAKKSTTLRWGYFFFTRVLPHRLFYCHSFPNAIPLFAKMGWLKRSGSRSAREWTTGGWWTIVFLHPPMFLLVFL